MDIQAMVNAQIALQRKQSFNNSNQLTLGELRLKAEALIGEHANKMVVYENGQHPTTIDSWRGAYEEIALDHEIGSPVLTLDAFYTLVSSAIGKEFYGYKGGDFLMTKNTPVWVANYGGSGGFDNETTAVFDLIIVDEQIIIISGPCEY